MGTIALSAALAGLTGAIDMSGADSVALPAVTCASLDSAGNVGVDGALAVDGAVSAGTTVTAGTGLTVTLGNATLTNGNLALTHSGSIMTINGTQVVPPL